MAPEAASPNCRKDSSSERTANAPHRLRDSLLVLDERKPNITLTVGAEAAAGTDGHVRLAQQPKGEFLRRLARRDSRPDEHRGARPRHVPANAREPVAQRIPSTAVDLGNLGRQLTNPAHVHP